MANSGTLNMVNVITEIEINDEHLVSIPKEIKHENTSQNCCIAAFGYFDD